MKLAFYVHIFTCLLLSPHIWQTLNSLGRDRGQSVPACRHFNVLSTCHVPITVSGNPVNTVNGLLGGIQRPENDLNSSTVSSGIEHKHSMFYRTLYRSTRLADITWDIWEICALLEKQLELRKDALQHLRWQLSNWTKLLHSDAYIYVYLWSGAESHTSDLIVKKL